jgi:taurine transport system substrate-binding protein
MLKRTVMVWLVAALAVLTAACAPSSQEAVEVRIGFQTIPNTEAIVKANGWHEATMKNAKVEWLDFESGRDVNTALTAGSIDIGLLGSTLVATGLSKGLDYEVIWIADVIGANEALVVRSDRGIESVNDLQGKTVAVTFGSTTQYALLGALKLNGVDPETVNILDMRPPDMVAAWQRGDLDAGYVWQPSLAQLIEGGGRVLLTSGDLVDQGIVTADVIVVRRAFAQKHPDLVTDYIVSQNRAVEQYRTNPEEAAAAVAKLFEISTEEALSMMNELIWLSAEEHATDRYLGSGGNPGAFASVLADTAAFLKSEDFIQDVPSQEAIMKAVNSRFVELAMKSSGGNE